MQAAIEVRSVSHGTRAGEAAVRDVSLTVGLGELTAITGASGSGKSTLLDALSGLRPPASGSVIRYPTVGPGPSGPSGYVSADDLLPPALPLARALRYTAALRSVPGREQAVRAALDLAGLAARASVPCGALSPGERKRAAIAAELMSRPAQLFLEEPTAGLDPAQAAEVLRLLRRLSDDGSTVVLTTGSPLDAARCDKVAVLAAGGHLAFFGTPAAALGYFGADSLEEIYERLAGLGDPAVAWSRRFFHFPPVGTGFAPAAPLPGAAFPLPDSAGPLSAGRVNEPALPDTDTFGTGALSGTGTPFDIGTQFDTSTPFGSGISLGSGPPFGTSTRDAGRSDAARSDAARGGGRDARRPAGGGPVHGPARAGLVRQLLVLGSRNAEVLARSATARAVAVAAPVALLLAFAALTGAGAFDAPRAAVAWVVLGGFGLGLAYGLPQADGELDVLRAERFAGLRATAYALAKLAVALPVAAAAGAVALVLPAACGRLPHGYAPAYLTLLLSAAVALALALLLGAFAAAPPRRTPDGPAPWLSAIRRPALLLAGAALTLLDRPSPTDWLGLAALAVVLAAAAAVVIGRRLPVGRSGS